jgi:carbonic anhydrase
MTQLTICRRLFLTGAAGALAAVGGRPALALREEVMVQTYESQAEMTPDAAIALLKEGNARFVASRAADRDLSEQMRVTSGGQFPFAAVVACIDSRTPPEIIFDQGIGDIFSARIAGNFVDDDILGSLEFACALSGARAIVVVGHTNCGAIRGAVDDVIYGNLTETLANIKPAVAAVEGFDGERNAANPAFVQAVADKNVELTLARIMDRSPILAAMVESGELGLNGAMYDIHTGEVTFG